MKHFVKALTPTDSLRLVVTKPMVAMLLPVDPDRDGPVKVLDVQRCKVYEFKLSGKRGSKYQNPVFQSREWRMFVEDRSIAARDHLLYWEEEDLVHGTQY